MRQHYDWTRYWYPRGAALQLTEDGFLPDPTRFSEAMMNREVISLGELTTTCGVLLGEIGSGRSIALKDEYLSIVNAADGHRSASLVDLSSITSQEILRETLKEALNGRSAAGAIHHLLLDGVDECPLPLNTLRADVTRQLRGAFGHASADGLRVRITCRTPAWSERFQQDLQSVFE
jgi:hypothetical protein